ncbi:MAG: carboxypeptidase-like regulatory domain-containing protein, partial [Cytophagaceae bacterium]|nr:carboxypeptidase-like regulatory domain-containing protein [Cytophagaceae bacterium]MDW8457361.1 carboxypeptidase-like regulatory domain-containing protein [Cytophagaceae bacterium]
KAKAEAEAKSKSNSISSKSEDEDDFLNDIFAKSDILNTSTIKGIVQKNGTTETLNGVQLIIKSDGKEIAKTSSILGGAFSFNKLEPNKDYEIYASKPGYYEQKIFVQSSVLKPGQVGNIKIYLDVDPNQKDVVDQSNVVILLEGKVIDEVTKQIVSGAKVTLVNNIDKSTQETTTDEKGNYKFNLKKQAHYTLKASKGTCVSGPNNKSTIGIQTSQTLEQNIFIKCP